MGVVTPNMSIYVPSAGETNYDSAFAAGMANIDQHDHSGAPNKGVPISGSGIAQYAVTYDKLNADVVLAGGGLAVDSGSPNKLKVDGILLPFYQLNSNGFVCRTGPNAVAARTITGTSNQIEVVNGDGVSGNPVLSIPNNFDISNSNIICNSINVLPVSSGSASFDMKLELDHDFGTFITVENLSNGPGSAAGFVIQGEGGQNILIEMVATGHSNSDIAGYFFYNMAQAANGCIHLVGGNKLFKWAHGSVVSGTTMVLDPTTGLYPNVDSGSSGNLSCGKSGNRWTEVWAANGTIQTSDSRFKGDIEPSSLGLDFILDLLPKQFKVKGGIRPHFGFIAQEVKRTLEKFSTDFAGYIDPSVKDGKDGLLGLRYEEFIAPITLAIQELYCKVRALERRLGGN